MKTGNEKVYYNVDTLHEAMNRNRQIRFKYGEWNAAKELVEKKGGTEYRVSPWALTWDDENYYLIAFDEAAGIIKHYRVDKMLGIDLTEAERTGQDSFEDFDLAAFARKTFGMFGGPDANVVLRCSNHLAGVIIDRFGREVSLVPEDGDHFHVHVARAGGWRPFPCACHRCGEPAVLGLGHRNRTGDRDRLSGGGQGGLQRVPAHDTGKIYKSGQFEMRIIG